MAGDPVVADNPKPKADPTVSSDPVDNSRVSGADDAGVSHLHAGFRENPDKPDPASIAQVQDLKDEAK